MPKYKNLNIPYSFFTCPCGYEFIMESGDENRIRKLRDMKMRLHKKKCSIEVDDIEHTQYNSPKQTAELFWDTKKLINLTVDYGENDSEEQLQYNFIKDIEEY